MRPRPSLRALRQLAGFVTRMLVYALLVVVALALIFALSLRTNWGRRRVLAELLPVVSQQFAGGVSAISIAALDGDLLTTATFDHVVIRDREGVEAISIARLTLRYALARLLWRDVRVSRLEATGVRVRARRLGGGRWNLTSLWKARAKGGGTPWDVHIADARVIGELAFSGHVASVASVALRGGVSVEAGVVRLDRVQIEARTDGNVIEELAPALRLAGPLSLSALVAGALTNLSVRVRLRPPRGECVMSGVVAVSPRGVDWTAQATITNLDPALLAKLPHGMPHGVIAGQVNARGHNADAKLAIPSLSLRTPAGFLSATGNVEIPGSVSLFVRGEVALAPLTPLLAAAFALPQAMSSASTLSSLRGRVSLRAEVTGPPRELALHATLQGASLSISNTTLHEVSAQIGWSGERGDVVIDARNLVEHGRLIDRAKLVAAVDLRRHRRVVSARLSAQFKVGPNPGNAELSAHAELFPDGRVPAHLVGRIDRLVLVAGDVNMQLAQATDFRADRHGVSLAPLVIQSGNGSLVLRGTLRDERLNAWLALKSLDVTNLARSVFPSLRAPAILIGANLHAFGTLTSPRVDGTLDATVAAGMRKTDRWRLQSVLSLEDEQLHADGALDGPDAGSVRFSVSLPSSPSPKTNGRRQELNLRLAARSLVLGQLRALAMTTELDSKLPRLSSLSEKLRELLTTRVDVDARVSGTVLDPNLSAVIRAGWPATTSLAKGRAQLSVTSANGATTLQTELQSPRAGHLQLTASAPLSLRALVARGLDPALPLHAHLVADVDLGALPIPAAGLLASFDRAHATVDAAVDGTLGAPIVDARLSSRNLRFGGGGASAKPIDAAARLSYRGTRATMSATLASAGTTLATGSGAADVDVTRFLDSRASGAGSFKTALLGPLSLALRIPGHGRDGGSVDLAGTIDPASGAITGTSTADRFDLTVLSSLLPVLRGTAGRLSMNLKVAGTLSAPSITGQLETRDAAFSLRNDAHLYDHIDITAVLSPGRLDLRRLSAHSGEGSATATARLTLDGLRPSTVDGTIDAKKFALSFGGAIATSLDGHIIVKAHTSRPPSAPANAKPAGLEGTIVVEKGAISLPAIVSGGNKKLQPLGPLTDVVYVDAEAQRRAKKRSAEATGMTGAGAAGFPIQAELRIPTSFSLRGPDVQADARGDLRVVLRGVAIAIFGSVSSLGGWVDVLGNRFSIEHARLSFAGRDPINPDLDIRLSRPYGDVTIYVDVRGTTLKPVIDLSSEPPRYSRAELVALVVSGEPPGSQVDNSTLEQKVVGSLSGAVVGSLRNALLPSLPFDVLRVNVGNEGAPGVATTRLEVGKYITHNIYLSYVHQFGTPTGLFRFNSNQATVEWRFARRFEIDTTYGDAGVGGIDFVFRYRF